MKSKKIFEKSLFIFRRDLRLEDNTGLISALKESVQVIPAFIFDDRQANKENNKYFSENAFAFMIESLKELDKELRKKGSKLFVFYGIAEEVIEEIINKESINAVYVNRDYTPFSIRRDTAISLLCKRENIEFKSFSDIMLNEMVLKLDGKPYTVFTAFWKRASQIPVRKPEQNNFFNYAINYSSNEKISFPECTNNIKRMKGGRSKAIKILKNIGKLRNYEYVKDYPYVNGTSRLSAHLKFGTVSVREVYWSIVKKLSQTHPLIRQLYWRDFFYHIGYNFPKVFNSEFQDKYKKIKWSYSNKRFNAWKNGITGFPIVDAGMRELNATGYMHNRVRMIVASFFVKDLHIDWRLGEKYFSQKLVDYDPCINNGNWQWVASTGCDSQPYFRIFNPWLQQIKFDPKCKYIKKWVTELRHITSSIIHKAYKHNISGYPKPIVDHNVESQKAIFIYKAI